MHDRDPNEAAPASSPCQAPEVAPDYFDPHYVAPQQALDVARWRRTERERLRRERGSLPAEARRRISDALAEHLDALLARHFGDLAGRVISAYWPIKDEPDLRPWMTRLHDAGAIVALPLVETPRAPLAFRRWTPDTRLVRGHWNIPVPPPDAAQLTPGIALAPLLGWDAEGFRLGYGGGYFDRTLAALSPRPFAIGTGLQGARLATIYPQPHDIRLDAIVTEAGAQYPPESTS